MSKTLSISSLPIDDLTVRGEADAIALNLRGEMISYAAMDAMVGRIAHWLAAQEFGPGARVASWLPKTREACLLALAVARAGYVYVPINPLLKRAQVGHILADSGASMLITQKARMALLEAGDVPAGCETVEDSAVAAIADGEGEALGPSNAAPDDLAAILYTSGSTGKPKGVVLSHQNLWLGAESVAHYLRITPDDRTLCVLPLSFDYGQNQLYSTWYGGACAYPFDYLAPKDVVRAVERGAITTLAGVPPLWVQLVEADWPEGAAASLRRMTNSGGALTRPLVKQLRALAPHADLYAMYGLTEAFRSTYLPPALIDERPDSMGKAIPHAEILVVRPDGSLTDDDEPGELVHCGPLVAQGYWQDEKRTAERFKLAPPASQYGGMSVWSGDTVRRDEQGFLYFVGRTDSMIKSAGNRISPSEIEEVAVASGIAAEAIAFGLPDPKLGQAIVLAVRPAKGENGDGEEQGPQDEEALRAYLKSQLPNFMQPAIITWHTQFPRNPNGKIDRVAIEQAMRETATP